MGRLILNSGRAAARPYIRLDRIYSYMQLTTWNCSSQRTGYLKSENRLFPREAGTASWCDLCQHCDLGCSSQPCVRRCFSTPCVLFRSFQPPTRYYRPRFFIEPDPEQEHFRMTKRAGSDQIALICFLRIGLVLVLCT